MHDDRTLVEARIDRILRERIRPAVYRESVPLQTEVWHAPGEPVPVADGLRGRLPPDSRATRPGARRGAPAGSTSPARCPPSGPAGPSRRSSTSGSPRTEPGFQREGLALPARRHRGQGPQPAQPLGPHRRPAAGGEQVDLYVEAAANPAILGTTPADPARRHRRPPATSRCTGSRRIDLAVFDADGLGARPRPRGARRADARAARRGAAPLGHPARPRAARSTRSTCRTSPARRPRRATALAPVLAAPGARQRAPRSARSGTRTSTRRGCGRCARPCARSPAPSPT